MSFDRPLEITSIDIDRSKFTFDSLVEMRKTFPDVEDLVLCRFLIARTGDIAKAKDLLNKHLEWKSKNLPVLKSTCLNEFKKGKLYMNGFDKDGHPLLIWHAKLNIYNDRDLDEMGRMIIWWMEYAKHHMPKDKSKITLIVDRSDFKNENNDIEFTRHVAGYFQDNYPECLYRAIVYPSGFLFYGIWNIVKWFLDPVTQAKVQPMLQLSGVQQFVDDQYIPSCMGGSSSFKFNPDDFVDPYTSSEMEGVSSTSPPLAHFENVSPVVLPRTDEDA